VLVVNQKSQWTNKTGNLIKAHPFSNIPLDIINNHVIKNGWNIVYRNLQHSLDNETGYNPSYPTGQPGFPPNQVYQPNVPYNGQNAVMLNMVMLKVTTTINMITMDIMVIMDNTDITTDSTLILTWVTVIITIIILDIMDTTDTIKYWNSILKRLTIHTLI